VVEVAYSYLVKRRQTGRFIVVIDSACALVRTASVLQHASNRAGATCGKPARRKFRCNVVNDHVAVPSLRRSG
jgi:hypothetical protein